MASEPSRQSGLDQVVVLLTEALTQQASRGAPTPRWLLMAFFLAMVLVFLTVGGTAGIMVYEATRDADDANQLRLEWQADLDRAISRPVTSTGFELQFQILNRLEQLERRIAMYEPQATPGLGSAPPLVTSDFPDQGVPVVPVRRRSRGASSIRLESATALSDQEKAWLDIHNKWGKPLYDVAGNRTLLVREGWTGSHNNTEKISDWVSYVVSAEYIGHGPDRTDDFREDPNIRPEYQAFDADYGNYGGTIHRGHQCPAEASTGRGLTVMSESFFMSNMTPQIGSLNSGKWSALEKRVRKWCETREKLWVITGPAYYDEDGDGEVEYHVIGSGVHMPPYYFKIIIDENGDEYRALAFLIENEKPISGNVDKWLTDRLKSINEIEEITGLDFIPNMPHRVEEDLEARKPTELWQ